MSSRHADSFNRYYSRKWQGHRGYWLDSYHPSALVYATCLNKTRNDAIIKLIPDGLTRVLDLGCGIGDLMRLISPRTKTAIGLDIAEVNARLARQNLLNDHLSNTEVLQSTAEQLPFSTGTFDVVVMADVLEHIPDVNAALKEVLRVLRPGGLFICVTPYPGIQKVFTTIDSIGKFPLKFFKRLFGITSSGNSLQHYENFMSPKLVKSALERNGLRPLKYWKICFYPGPEGGGLFQALMDLLYRTIGHKLFFEFSRQIIRLFAIIERLRVLNQKQLWIARV